MFAVGSDRTVKQIRKSRIEQEIDLHSFQLSSVCLSGDGKVLVSGRDSDGICELPFKYIHTVCPIQVQKSLPH